MSGTLILADEYPIILEGLQNLLQNESNLEILACCTTGAETLRAVRKHRPDILLLDIHLPLTNGLDVLKEIQNSKLPTRTIVFTTPLNDEEILEALGLGISGLVLKQLSTKLVVQCVRRVHGGNKWFERDALTRAAEKFVQRETIVSHAHRVLSPREIEVIRVVLSGFPNSEIAKTLHISEGTVKRHLHTIYKKLKVTSRLSLALYARNMGLC